MGICLCELRVRESEEYGRCISCQDQETHCDERVYGILERDLDIVRTLPGMKVGGIPYSHLTMTSQSC